MTELALQAETDPDRTRPAPRPRAARRRTPENDDREARWSMRMRAANRGDTAAYRRRLSEIAPMIRAMARRRLHGFGLSLEEAEAVVQETLIGLHRKRHSWDEDRPILPWIRAIATYKLLDAARRLGRTRRATAAKPLEDYADILAAPAPARDMTGVDLHAHVAALPSRERGVVTALAFEGASVETVAGRLGVGQSAVRVAFHRALARLCRHAEAQSDG